jgi:hypothetical protein
MAFGFTERLAIAVIMGLVFKWIRASIPGRSKHQGDVRVLEVWLPLKVFAVLFAFFLSAWVAFYLYESFSPVKAVVLIAMCAGFVLAVCLDAFRTRIEFDSQEVRVYSPWWQMRTVPWSAFREQLNKPGTPGYVFATTEYGKVRIAPFICGQADFLEHYKRMRGES